MSNDRGYEAVNISTKKIIVNNLVGGIAWGFGTVVGGTVVIGILAWLLSQAGFLPLVGETLASLQDTIESFRRLR